MSNAGIPDQGNRAVRANAFDVLIHRNGWFLGTFYGLWAWLAGLLSYARVETAAVETAAVEPLGWPGIAIIVIVAAGVTVGVALPLAFGFVEGIPMVLARLYSNRVREEGREEGREEANRAWETWNERREAAERDGLTFTEPPPTRNGTCKEN
jgi:hypothetical protein